MIKKENSYWFFLIILLVVIISFPALNHNYLFHDDWIHFSSRDLNCNHNGTCQWFNNLGRPFGFAILHLQYKLMASLHYTFIGRLITVFILISLINIIYSLLIKEGLPKLASFFIAFGIGVLPGALTSIAWVGSGFIISSLFISSIAFWFCQKFFASSTEGQCIKYFYLFMTIVLQISAALIYQTGSMFFLVFLVIIFIINCYKNIEIKVTFCTALKQMLFFLLSSIIYFIGFKYLAEDRLLQIDPTRGSLFNNIPNALLWFFDQPLSRSLELWFIRPSLGWSIYSYTVISIFLITTFLSSLRSSRRYFLSKKIIFIIFYNLFIYSVGIVCYLPVLISSFRLEVYRSSFVLSAYIFSIIVVQSWMLFVGFNALNKKIISVLLILTTSITFLCYRNMLNEIVLPKYYEYIKLATAMSMIDPNTSMASAPIHLIVPKQLEAWNTDEIGHISSEFTDEIAIMMDVIRSNANLKSVPISFGFDNVDFTNNNSIVIDLRDIRSSFKSNQVSWPKIIFNTICISSESNSSGLHLCGKAFDGRVGPNDFWESFVAPNKPVSLEISLDKTAVLYKYQFFAGELFNRMPVRWELKASNDRSEWILIDKRFNNKNLWTVDSFQEFKLTLIHPYRYYKFDFYESISEDILRIYEIKFYGADSSLLKLKP